MPMRTVTRTMNANILQGVIDLPKDFAHRQVEVTVSLKDDDVSFAFSDDTLRAIAEAKRISRDPSVKSYTSAKSLLDDCE